MKVLIVSDTHGRHAGIEEAIEREYPFQKLIHLVSLIKHLLLHLI